MYRLAIKNNFVPPKVSRTYIRVSRVTYEWEKAEKEKSKVVRCADGRFEKCIDNIRVLGVCLGTTRGVPGGLGYPSGRLFSTIMYWPEKVVSVNRSLYRHAIRSAKRGNRLPPNVGEARYRIYTQPVRRVVFAGYGRQLRNYTPRLPERRWLFRF